MKSRLGHLPTPWKYGLISLLAFIGISTAVPHLAGLTHQAPPEQPQPTATVSASQQVKAAEAPTPTQSPTPTITPSPTSVYVPPTKVYTPPTQAPTEQSSNQLDNTAITPMSTATRCTPLPGLWMGAFLREQPRNAVTGHIALVSIIAARAVIMVGWHSGYNLPLCVLI